MWDGTRCGGCVQLPRLLSLSQPVHNQTGVHHVRSRAPTRAAFKARDGATAVVKYRSNKVRSVDRVGSFWWCSLVVVECTWTALFLVGSPSYFVATDICVVRLCCVILTFVLFCVLLCTFTIVFVVASPSPLRITFAPADHSASGAFVIASASE